MVESLGMRWIYLPMHSYWRPSDVQVRAFLATVSDPNQQPVFVHCHKGQDRSGVMVAVYRVVRQGWRPQEAYAEARVRGMAGWNLLMRDTVLREAPQEYANAPPLAQ